MIPGVEVYPVTPDRVSGPSSCERLPFEIRQTAQIASRSSRTITAITMSAIVVVLMPSSLGRISVVLETGGSVGGGGGGRGGGVGGISIFLLLQVARSQVC